MPVSHEALVPGSGGGVHVPIRWPAFANAAARLAQSVTSADVSGLAFQADTKTLYYLSDAAPTWVALSGGAATSATWTQVAYATALPLDGNKYMPGQLISGAVAFTVAASPVAGGMCNVRLTANGTNTPTFTGIREHGSSQGFDIRSGILNSLCVWYDGTDAWYAWSQEVNAVASDLFPPTVSSASVIVGTPTMIVVVFNEPLDAGFVPAFGSFGITNTGGSDSITGISLSGSSVTLTKSRATLAGDVITISYTQPGTNNIRDVVGNLLANFTGQSVVNAVGASLVLQTLTGISESGGVYSWVSGGIDVSQAANANVGLSGDGYIQATLQAYGGTGTVPCVFTSTSPSYTPFGTAGTYGAYLYQGKWAGIASGAISPNVVNTLTCAAGDIVRIVRSGTTMSIQVSKNAGSSWTTIDSRAVDSARRYLNITYATGGSTFSALTGTGLT